MPIAIGRSLFFVRDLVSGTGIGTSSTNSTGLNNAVRPANKLVNIKSGTAGAVNEISGLILPATEINSGIPSSQSMKYRFPIRTGETPTVAPRLTRGFP